MFDSLTAMLRDDEGATLVEYSLIVALIAGVCIAIITTVGGDIKNLFTTIDNSVNTANKSVT